TSLIDGTLAVSGGTAGATPILVGGGGCGPGLQAGSASITGNAATVEVAIATTGSITVRGNTGGGNIKDSAAGGVISGANTPAFVATGNTAAGVNQASGPSC